jgi:hypothetical protein
VEALLFADGRPTEFGSKEGSGVYYNVLERVKK